MAKIYLVAKRNINNKVVEILTINNEFVPTKEGGHYCKEFSDLKEAKMEIKKYEKDYPNDVFVLYQVTKKTKNKVSLLLKTIIKSLKQN